MADITVNTDNIVGTNKLSIGFQLDHNQWEGFRTIPTRRELAKDAGFKLVRQTDFRSSGPRPCVSWNEATKTGTWNWTELDDLIRKIFSAGAEPLICLGRFTGSGPSGLPPGMATNSVTLLPYPESFAAYSAEWVKHFKNMGLPVRYYEIANEIQGYICNGFLDIDYTRLNNFRLLFNETANRMRLQNNRIYISFDFVTMKQVLDWWLTNGGAEVDTLNFHKYDEYRYPYADDATMLGYAETKFFGPWPLGGYSITDSQRVYYEKRGRLLPIINSESNMNSKWQNGTDPRIPMMVGAVWLALVLRMGVLNGVSYNVYYSYTGGGFGMINASDNKPFYPYYVHWMLGRNLGVNDKIFEANSTSENVRVLAWNHHRQLNILLLCKTTSPQTINLQGVTGQLEATWIDNMFPYTDATVQTAILNAENPITLNGYTVMLLQHAMPISLVKIAAALTVTLIIIGGAYYFVTRRG